MKTITWHTLVALFAASVASASASSNWTTGMKEGKPEFKSMGPLAFGPEGILFVADTKAAAITAIATGDTKASTGGKSLKIEGINEKLAGLLGTSSDQILID